jgi:hypothetical protein
MIGRLSVGGTAAATTFITMRIRALTLVFLAGTASVVSAAPGRGETTARIGYNEKHGKQRGTPPATPPSDAGWVELASATPASHGREFIWVGAGAGTFTQLRLTAASGRPTVRSVRVDYKDGSHKTFPIAKVLGGKRRPTYLDLRGAREIRQVIVTTARTPPGSYIVEANPGDIAAR